MRNSYLAYGLPGLPLAALGLPLYVYLPTFYAETLGLGAAAVGVSLFAARLLDVFTDPVAGWASDRFRLPFGNRKGLILLGAPLLLIGVEQLFRPETPVGPVYLFIWMSLAYLGWTLIAVPYQAWGAELSTDYHRRSKITASREGCVLLGTVLAVALPAAITGADNQQASLDLMATLLWFAIPISLLAALVVVPEPERLRPPVAWRAGLRLIARNRPLKLLMAAYLVNGIANGLPATLFLLFVAHVLEARAASGALLGIYFVAGIAALPLWIWLARRLSKHRAWSLSMLLVCAVFMWVPFLGAGDVIAFGVICLLSGLSLGADLALPASIQADVVDVDTAEGGGGRAGLFFALWNMATKLALALAVGIAFPLLDLAGFTPGGDNPPATLWMLTLLYGGLPVLFKLTAVLMVWRFPLDEARQTLLRQSTVSDH
ncbi:MAG: MFS transporter [Gammaproteobacteria bacterium]|nr:MFS transporter [Gammaproteobacteria bacterium]